MGGMTHQVNIAPPVNRTSSRFMADSIAIIEIKDMPIAVLNATGRDICLVRIKVSSAIEVRSPLIMASIMICHTGHAKATHWA